MELEITNRKRLTNFERLDPENLPKDILENQKDIKLVADNIIFEHLAEIRRGDCRMWNCRLYLYPWGDGVLSTNTRSKDTNDTFQIFFFIDGAGGERDNLFTVGWFNLKMKDKNKDYTWRETFTFDRNLHSRIVSCSSHSRC